ncbi:MAPEG family protein [Undibacterium terreum]|uniref:Membrane protein n=1 Tax=Undibacterium terreum TaxID=1224302 RepID=A0A916UF61_9BURK|nr:MAPEG family protein [Undibacterium terreum]GGC70727.1 membrane protein [Undibacterium terreum]
MTFELYCVGWTLVLAIVQILLASLTRTAQFGPKWNMGARDGETPPLNPVSARLLRAQANLFETMPVFIAAILVAAIAGRTGELTHWGALIYLTARVVYVPLYALGIPVVRTLTWSISMAGIVMCLLAILR